VQAVWLAWVGCAGEGRGVSQINAALTQLNPTRFRRCLRCGAVVDLMDPPRGLLWDPTDDTFRHTDCEAA
jgi:hypothetical protein